MIQTPKLDLESLLDAIADRVAEKLKPSLPGATPAYSAAHRLLTVDQAASYPGRTKASVQHMISAAGCRSSGRIDGCFLMSGTLTLGQQTGGAR